MRYCGTCAIERIMVNPMNDLHEVHFIELEKAANEPMLYVTCCCAEDWVYIFSLEDPSDYERIKFNIMQTMFECETMEELLDGLSELFEDGFEELLIKDECDGSCEHCDHLN